MFEEENPFHDLEQEYLMKKPSEEEQKKSGPYKTGDLAN